MKIENWAIHLGTMWRHDKAKAVMVLKVKVLRRAKQYI